MAGLRLPIGLSVAFLPAFALEGLVVALAVALGTVVALATVVAFAAVVALSAVETLGVALLVALLRWTWSDLRDEKSIYIISSYL